MIRQEKHKIYKTMIGINMEEEVFNGKAFLKKSFDDENLYGKLSGLINNVLTERPKDAVELIENYMRKPVEKEKDASIEQTNLAKTQIQLFEKTKEEDVGEGGEFEEEFDIPLPNCAHQSFLFEQAAIGVGREEMQRIFLALKQLIFNHPLTSIRFWGKLFGLEANYIVAEVEFREGEGEDEEEEKEEEKVETSLDDEESDDAPAEENELPKSTWKLPPVVPKEEARTGANKKVYFVCNRPGDTWVKLPHVTPTEINVSRQIRKFLTGSLEAPVLSYPPFPGVEKNYLRAQIARISSSTQISPAGFYMFDDDEEEEEDEIHESYTVNIEFEGLSLRELVEPSMSNWVHHTQHILPQGRCVWYNPYEKPEEDFDEDELEEEEEEAQRNYVPPETGPNLLSSVDGDQSIDEIPAWSVQLSSRVLPEYAITVAKSNRWPGAYAVAKGKFYENVYIGWGQKYIGSGAFTPTQPPPTLEEYNDEGQTQEMDDPTVEEEKVLKEREDEARKAAEEMENVDDEDEDD